MNWQDEQKKVATGVTGKREWVGLTDEDLTWLCNVGRTHDQTWGMFIRTIEAKLKEKNSCNS